MIVAALVVGILGAGLGIPSARAANPDVQSNCGVTLRAEPTTSSAGVAVVPTGSIVSWSGQVIGGSWSAICGSTVAGSTWYAITAVNGQPVTTLYGVATIYAAVGLFRPLDIGPYIEGIDVSRWQNAVDFAAVAQSGKRFVVAKATEGIGFSDPRYSTNRSGAMAAGLAVSAYHYARPDLNPTNPQGEADWFVDQMGLAPGMLIPALDLEVAGSTTIAELQQWVGAWLDRVYARTGVRPMLYTSPAFWKKYLGDTTVFADAGYTVLWVAHWQTAGPTTPARNWSNRGWTFWQYDDCGSVPGIGGCVDLDRFNGVDLTSVTFGADFVAATNPGSVTVTAGASTSFALNITRTYFTAPIQVAVTGLPAGTTASLDAGPVLGTAATVTVATSRSGVATPVGSYPLTITASGPGVSRVQTVTLTVVDAAPPTLSVPSYAVEASTTLSTTVPVRVSWSAVDPDGIGSYSIMRQVDQAWHWLSLPTPTATSVVHGFRPGTAYRYAVQATDGTGSASDWSTGREARVNVVEQTSSSIKYGGTWRTSATSAASGGSIRYATGPGASASYTFSGTSVGWVAYKGPNRGSAKVYVDGVYKGTISLYSKVYAAKRIVYAATWPYIGTHTIRIVAVGTPGHPRIDLDGFVRLTLR